MPRKKVITLIVLFIISILIGLIPDGIAFILNKTDFKYDQVLYTAVTFSVLELINIIINQSKIEEYINEEKKINNINDSCNKDLCTIGKSFNDIVLKSDNENDIFIKYYLHQLNALATNMRDSVINNHLKVELDHYVATNYVLSTFDFCVDKTWRFTWPFESGDLLFSEIAWQRYFDEASKLIEKNKIKNAKILVIIDNKEILNESKLINLFHYAYNKKRIQIKWCLTNDFSSIEQDSRLDNHLDFGIYGDKLVFWYDTYEPSVTGTYSKEPEKVLAYSELFESVWNSSAITHTYNNEFTNEITIEELFERDRK